MFTEIILLQHSFHFQFPRAGLCLLHELPLSSRIPLHPPGMSGTPVGLPALPSQFCWISLYHSPSLYTHHTGHSRAKGNYLPRFSHLHTFAQADHSTLRTLFFFNCSQADNHSSRTSFSVEPPGTHTTVRSPLPTRLCHVLKERDAEELNTESPRDTEERESPEVPLEIWLIYWFTW